MILKLATFLIIAITAIGDPIDATDSDQSPYDSNNSISPKEIHQIMWDNLKSRLIQYQEASALMKADIGNNWMEYDISYYRIELEIDHVNELLYGQVGIFGEVVVSSLDSIVIHLLNDLTVDSIYNSSGNLSYLHSNDLIKINLDHSYNQSETFDFTVVYHGLPSGEGGFLGFDFTSRGGKPLIVTLSEPTGSRSWWPCNDITHDKADSVDIIITVDTSLVVSSNGSLISDADNGNGTHTVWWKERYPIAPYLVSLGIHPYAVWYDWYHYSPADSMPLHFYVYPDHDLPSRPHFGQLAHMIEVLSSRFGEYPFLEEKYGCTHFNWIGAMEHQTNTSTTSSDFGYLKSTIVHELAHQWWGDMITCSDWHHVWINEGFAVYSEALFFEIDSGLTYYHDYMNSFEYAGTSRSIYIDDTTDIYNIFNAIVYDKGGWVLHMLRHIIGDESFFESLIEYRNQYIWSTASIEDFQQVVETVSGMDLDYFFNEWIYGVGRPQYRYSYFSEENTSGGWDTYLCLKQIQSTEPQVFEMPIDIVLSMESTEETYTVFNDRRQQDFMLHTDSEPLLLSVDPDRWVSRVLSQETYTINILTESLTDGNGYQIYAETLLIKGAPDGFYCSIIGGELPTGLSLETNTGAISGLAESWGDHPITIKATDYISPQYSDTAKLNIYIADVEELPGDVNFDGAVNVGDVVYLVNHVFKSSSPPVVPNWADVNADCVINVGDIVHITNYIFESGSPAPQIGCAE